MVFQFCLVGFQFRLPVFNGLHLPVQALRLLQFSHQFPLLGLCLGQQAGFIKPAFVFQILQFLGQGIGASGFITGGDQGVQPSAESLILSHRHILQPHKTGSGKYALFHAQQHLAAVGSGQLCDRDAAFRLIGLEHTKDAASFAGTLDGNVPALPADVHSAGHRCTGPGGIPLFVREKILLAS